jgi:protease I
MSTIPAEPRGRAVVLVESGYNELEFWYPVLRFRESGAEVFIAGPSGDQAYYSRLGYPVIPDGNLAAAREQEPDVLIVPGGDAGRKLVSSVPFQELVGAQSSRGALVAVAGELDDLDRSVTCATPDDLPAFMSALLQGLGGQ